MTARRDPIDVPISSTPSHAELDATDQLLDAVSRGTADASLDPAMRLLRAATSRPSDDELADPVGFARLVARGATPTAAVPTIAAAPLVTAAAARRGRTSHVRRALAAKVAIIVGVTVLGVAGAGAATGIYRATTTTEDPTPTTVSEPVTTTAAGEAPASSHAGTDGTGSTGGRPFWSIFETPANDAADPASPGAVGEAHGNSPNAGGNPNPGSTGATNGASPNAGVNPDPGSTGEAHGNSPNAGGKAP